MEAVKLPPALELPGAIDVPPQPIQLPNFRNPFWVPIPVYRDDIPPINKSGVQTNDKEEAPPEDDEDQEQSTKEEKVDSKSEVKTEVNPQLNPPQIVVPPIALPPIQLPPQAAPPPAPPPAPPIQPEFKEVQKVTLPILEVEVPLPRTEIVVTAVSTAAVASVASVGGTLVATAAFKRIMQIAKPIFNAVLKKVAKARGKPKLTWARQRLKDKPKAL